MSRSAYSCSTESSYRLPRDLNSVISTGLATGIKLVGQCRRAEKEAGVAAVDVILYDLVLNTPIPTNVT